MNKANTKRQLHNDISRRVLLIASILLAILLLGTAAFAYFTYRAQYDAVLNADGTIRLDAFDVLYEDLRSAEQGYGTTPENPFVIDSPERWSNLIKLNNTGKLDQAREDGQRFYFCLQFDETDVKQVLDLDGQGSYAPVGTGEYPFADDLSGIVYAYDDPALGETVYYSGCIESGTVIGGELVTGINTVVDADVSAFQNGDVLFILQKTYDKVGGKLVLVTHDTPVLIPASAMTPVHQVIANEKIVLDASEVIADNPVDVGVFGCIAGTGNVHDVILYNIGITCSEDVTPLASLWQNVLSLLSGHHRAGDTDERHIGIFAGHVDGNVYNISVAGQSTLDIQTKNVNYYSAYTTVGFFGPAATVGGIPVAQLISDSFTGSGNVGGCMFADAIYALSEEKPSDHTVKNGITYYTLEGLTHNGTALVESRSFTYGSFKFLLSDADNTVSNIWPDALVNAIDNGNGTVTLSVLDDKTHGINTAVLYCNEEYRYSATGGEDADAVDGNAAVGETRYTGVSMPDSSGSVIDAGKYLITARVANPNTKGGYDYFAAKIKASVDASGTVRYALDNAACDVTNYIMDETGRQQVYMSALWQVETPGTAVVFENSRFAGQYLAAGNEGALSLSPATGAVSLSYDVGNSAMYRVTNAGGVTVTDYLCFDPAGKTFSFGPARNPEIAVCLFNINNGYYLEEIESLDAIVTHDQYIMAAEHDGIWTMIGLATEENEAGIRVLSTVVSAWDEPGEPTYLSVEKYDAHRNYVWLMDSMNLNVDTHTFVMQNRLDPSLYLGANGNVPAGITESTSFAWETNAGNDTTALRFAKYFWETSRYLTFDGGQFTVVSDNPGTAKLHFYRLVPDVEDPLYITYAGSSVLLSESTTLSAGEYAIVAKPNGGDRIAKTNASGVLTGINKSPTADDWHENGMVWQLQPTAGETGDTFTLVCREAGMNASFAPDGNTVWRYDAVNHRLFHDGVYLGYSNGSGFFTGNGVAQGSDTYEIVLYRHETEYSYTGVALANPALTTAKHYFISSAPLGGLEVPYFLGRAQNAGEGSAPVSAALSAYTFAGGTLTTTQRLDNYAWSYEQGSQYVFLSGTVYWDQFCNVGDGSLPKVYLGISDTSGARTLQLHTSSQRPSTLAQVPSTGFEPLTEYQYLLTTYNYSDYGFILNFSITLGETFVHTTGTAGGFTLLTNSESGYRAQSMPTVYEYTGKTSRPVLTPVSEAGDELLANMDYMLAAELADENGTQYFAISRDGATAGIFGTDVTSQVQASLTAGASGIRQSVMVPVAAAWTQTSKTAELSFYHVADSDSNTQYYLSAGGNAMTTTGIGAKLTNTTAPWHYDAIHKRLSVVQGNTTYYVRAQKTQDGAAFSLVTDAAQASVIYAVHIEATYLVNQVTDWGADNLASGEFVIVGQSPTGYTAIGTNGSDVLWDSVNLTTNLSEAAYLAMQNYVWAQSYYDNHTDIQYLSDIADGSGVFSPMSVTGNGTFSVLTRKSILSLFTENERVLQPYAAEFAWNISRTPGGNWKLVNRSAVGNAVFGTNAGENGLGFSDQSVTSASVVQPTVALEKTITGDFANTVEWSTEVSNIVVRRVDIPNTPITSLSILDYYLISEVGGREYIVGCSADGIELKVYSSGTTYSLEFQWSGKYVNQHYQLQNRATGKYLHVTSVGQLGIQDGVPNGYFSIQNNYLQYAYLQGDIWVPYRYTQTSVLIRKDKTTSGGVPYTAFLYAASYPRSGRSRTVTLTPISDADGTLAGDNRFLVIVYTDGKRYIVGSSSATAFQTSVINSPTIDPDTGVMTYKTSNTAATMDKYRIKVEGSNGHYTLKFNSGSYFTPPAGDPNNYIQGNTNYKYTLTSAASDITYNDERGVYLSGGADLGPFGISSVTIGFPMTSHAAGDTAGGSTVLYHWDGSTWQECQTAPEPGETYAMVIRKYDADVPDDPNAHYFLVTYNGSALSGVDLGTDLGVGLSRLTAAIAANSGARMTALAGTTGAGVKFAFNDTLGDPTQYVYLTVGESSLAASTAVPAEDWAYVYNTGDSRLSRMWSARLATESAPEFLDVYLVEGQPEASYFALYGERQGTSTLFYPVTDAGDGHYTVGSLATSIAAGNLYTFAIVKDGHYYLVSRDEDRGAVVPFATGEGVPESVTANMVWSVHSQPGGKLSIYDPSGTKQIFVRTEVDPHMLALSDSDKQCTWSYSATVAAPHFDPVAAADTSELSLFKITKNTGFDEVTDVYTRLSGKRAVEASMHVTTAGFLLVAQVDEAVGEGVVSHFYSLAMVSPERAVTLDISDTFRDTRDAGMALTVFDASVWSQLGSDFHLIFDNQGFPDASLHPLTGSSGSATGNTPTLGSITDLSGDLTAYTWNLHTLEESGYLLGYTDTSHGTVLETYLYFDASDRTFRLTADKKVAEKGTRVKMYELHNEINDVVYQTFNIAMKSDGVTVQNLPLEKTSPKDITVFNSTSGIDLQQALNGRIDGEYVVIAEVNKTRYALTYDEEGNLNFSDVSLLFSGNASLMGSGANAAYVLSVNTKYIWQQTGAGLTTSTDYATGIQLRNVGWDRALSLDGTDTPAVLTYSGTQLYAGSSYLCFDTTNGFTVGEDRSAVSIYLYAVGCSDTATSGKPTIGGEYVYYETGLPEYKDLHDFSDFSHEIMRISDLKQYMVTYGGSIDYELGWDLDRYKKLTDCDSTVYFEGGIDFTDLTADMQSVSMEYNLRNAVGNRTQSVNTLQYYAPEGALAFAIPYASAERPVFLNVVVSTELAQADLEETLRWLALWRLADVDAESAQITMEGVPEDTELTAAHYANALIANRLQPYAAIPLPNHRGSVASGASDVYLVNEEAPHTLSQLSDTAHGVTGGGWDHLIAHTFVLDEPGVYYLGSTGGSVAYAYVSIYDMYMAEPGEDGDIYVSDEFTLDFVWGTVDGSAVAESDFGSDAAIADVAWVKRTGSTAETRWRHSNIAPEFIAGTAGNGDSPVDELKVIVSRDKPETADGTANVSFVNITLSGEDAEQVLIINSNSAYDRAFNRYRLIYPDAKKNAPPLPEE